MRVCPDARGGRIRVRIAAVVSALQVASVRAWLAQRQTWTRGARQEAGSGLGGN
jgi:hypothetical protein